MLSRGIPQNSSSGHRGGHFPPRETPAGQGTVDGQGGGAARGSWGLEVAMAAAKCASHGPGSGRVRVPDRHWRACRLSASSWQTFAWLMTVPPQAVSLRALPCLRTEAVGRFTVASWRTSRPRDLPQVSRSTRRHGRKEVTCRSVRRLPCHAWPCRERLGLSGRLHALRQEGNHGPGSTPRGSCCRIPRAGTRVRFGTPDSTMVESSPPMRHVKKIQTQMRAVVKTLALADFGARVLNAPRCQRSGPAAVAP